MSGAEQPLDLAALLQQLTQQQAAPQQAAALSLPHVIAAPQQQQIPNLEQLLSAQLQQQQQQPQQQINPLAMLMQPNTQLYQNLARMLIFGQMMQQQQQQQTLPAADNALLMNQHLSLKRAAVMPQLIDRKRSCPLPAAPPPPPPRSPTPPIKKMLANLSPEQKAKNEVFRKEIMRRLDVILLEELNDEKDADAEDASVDDDIEEEEEESMGAAGSAFRRILSRSDASPISSLTSSGPNSPPCQLEALSTETIEMLTELARKHRIDGRDVVEEMDDIKFEKYYPQSWNGKIVMKSSEMFVNLHLISGSREFLQNVLGEAAQPPQREAIRINQRMRLDTGVGREFEAGKIGDSWNV